MYPEWYQTWGTVTMRWKTGDGRAIKMLQIYLPKNVANKSFYVYINIYHGIVFKISFLKTDMVVRKTTNQ